MGSENYIPESSIECCQLLDDLSSMPVSCVMILFADYVLAALLLNE